MRLTEQQQQVIRTAIHGRDPEAQIILFGSRVHDEARGGDIDLLILSDKISFHDEWGIRRDILDRIGWQKLDLIVRKPSRILDAISQCAMESGVRL